MQRKEVGYEGEVIAKYCSRALSLQRRHKTRRQLQAKKAAIAKLLVNKANELANPLSDLQSFHKFEVTDGTVLELFCKRVKDLSPEELTWVFSLMERNMKKMYEISQWGWNEKAKHRELTESAAWYLLAFCNGSPMGFSHFRFDMDNSVEVLYCYELQLEPSARRKGLGRFMMQILEAMAYQNQMQKVVLTVFKHNSTAIPFFQTLGIDRICWGHKLTMGDLREDPTLLKVSGASLIVQSSTELRNLDRLISPLCEVLKRCDRTSLPQQRSMVWRCSTIPMASPAPVGNGNYSKAHYTQIHGKIEAKRREMCIQFQL